MSNLLYYPHINLPNSAWTIRAILYYENIGSIIPEQYFYEPEHFEPFMREALRNELIEFINPIDALDNPGHVSDVFLTYLTNTPRIIDRIPANFLNLFSINKFPPQLKFNILLLLQIIPQ